jgi:hypothetical protein
LREEKLTISNSEENNGSIINFYVGGLFPTPQVLGNQQYFNIKWDECGISWTMMPLAISESEPRWKSIDHFSMLPYGWIPDDGVDFFGQFIRNLGGRWLSLCDSADEHLSRRVSKSQLIDILGCIPFSCSLI